MLEGNADGFLDLRDVGRDEVGVRLAGRAVEVVTAGGGEEQHRAQTTPGHAGHVTVFPDMRLTTRAMSCPRTTIPCSIRIRVNSDSTSESDVGIGTLVGAGADASGAAVALGVERRGGGPINSASISAPKRSSAPKPSCAKRSTGSGAARSGGRSSPSGEGSCLTLRRSVSPCFLP